jgi:hypothetical protein
MTEGGGGTAGRESLKRQLSTLHDSAAAAVAAVPLDPAAAAIVTAPHDPAAGAGAAIPMPPLSAALSTEIPAPDACLAADAVAQAPPATVQMGVAEPPTSVLGTDWAMLLVRQNAELQERQALMLNQLCHLDLAVGMKMVQKLEAQVDALCKERAQLERDKKGLENANVMLNRQLQVSHAAQLSKNQLCQIQHAELMSLRPQSGGGGQQTMQFNGTPYGQPQTTTTMQHQHFVRDHLSLALSNSL